MAEDREVDTDDAHGDAAPALAQATAEHEPRHEAACAGYCEAFARACDRPLAFSDPADCLATCEAWAPGAPGVRGDSVACHAAMVPGSGDAFGSCIAAGPDSPICADA